MFSTLLIPVLAVTLAQPPNPPPPKIVPPDQRTVQATPGVRTYEVVCALYQGNPQGKPKVLANPTLTVMHDRPVRFAVGGEVRAMGLDGPVTLPTGVSVSVRIKADQVGRVLVHMVCEEQSASESADGNVQTSSKGAKLLGTIKLGEKQTLDLGDKGAKNKSWVEVTIKEIPQPSPQ
jgi:hypothetical protein